MGTDKVISKKEADRMAKFKFGLNSFAIRVSSNNRNQRFGIMLVDNNSVFALGYGDSFETALLMAEKEVQAAKESILIAEKQKEEQRKYDEEVNKEVKSEK